MKTEIVGLSIELQARLILVMGAILTIIILYGLTNGFTGVQIPEEYKIIIGE